MIRLEFPKIRLEGLSIEGKILALKKQLDVLTDNLRIIFNSLEDDIEADLSTGEAVLSSNEIWGKIKKNVQKATAKMPYGEVDNTSTSTVFTASVPGITELKDGVCMMLRNGVVTSASGFTINVNGLGAKPVYNNLTTGNPITPTNPTRDTTIFNINYTMIFVYNEDLVTGGCWICYRGYDSNTNTIGYQVRTNSQALPIYDVMVRYRLMFTSADGTRYVPANSSTSTSATTSKTVTQRPINPFGAILYYGTTAQVASGSRPSVASLWQQYVVTLGYSFNRTGSALTLTSWKPVYIKCAPQSDGSAIIDATTPYVQDLPTTDDGKIYIFLGVAVSATTVEVMLNHPVYCYKNGGIHEWTGKEPTLSELGLVTGSYVYNDVSTTTITFQDANVDGKTHIICGAQDAGNPPLRASISGDTITVYVADAVSIMRVNYICY